MKLSPYIRNILLLAAIYSAIATQIVSNTTYRLLYAIISGVCTAIYTYSENTDE